MGSTKPPTDGTKALGTGKHCGNKGAGWGTVSFNIFRKARGRHTVRKSLPISHGIEESAF
jgi:hypothetical protein